MAINVTHSKVSTVPDGDDSSLIRPSDWNDDHVISGLGTMAEQNANAVAITGGTMSGVAITGYIPTTQKGAVNGVATLDGTGKVPISELPAAVIGALSYQGTWNASTNTPTLASGVGTKGYYYVVDVAGTTNLDGITDWVVGDWAVFNGTVWQQIDNTDVVTSVNGQVGAVVLTTTNIAEGTNEYFTTARARSSISAGTGISYNSGTGVVTNSAPDQTVALTGAGTTVVTGTYPNFTITSNDEFDGDVVGPASATDNAIARFDTATGKLIQNSVVTVSDTGAIAGATTITNLDYLDFDIAYNTTLGAGQLGWNGNDTLGLGMIGGNVVQHIGEDTFYYVKASATITKGQVIMFTGALGASGVILAAPSTGVTNPNYIMGIAAESIANNAFGLIQAFGVLRSVDTQGFADGDVVYYDSAVTGGYTTTYPTSGPIVIVGAVVNGGSAGGGVLQIRVSVTQRVTASTGISVSQNGTGTTITNTAPDQVVSITGGGTTTVTGTYPNFTVSSDDQYDGTVTSVSGTGTVNGLTLTGTVTTSGNLTLGGTLDLSSPPAIGGNTPAAITGTTITATTFNGSGSGITGVAQLASAQSFTAAQRGAVTALTDGATITPDFAVTNNFSVTLGGNRTLANPTNLVAGQSGVILVTQDGTGSRTLAYGSYWKFPNGTAPTLTTTAGAVDALVYYVGSSTQIETVFIGDLK